MRFKEFMIQESVISQSEAKKMFFQDICNKGKDCTKKTEVTARKAKEGEKIETYTSDGKETEKTAKKGDWVVTNTTGEKFILSNDVFLDRNIHIKGNRYKANGKSRALEYKGKNMKFMASWNEPMALKTGDMIVSPYKDDKLTGEIYRIARKEFDETYGN